MNHMPTYRPRQKTDWLVVHDSHTLPNTMRMLEWLKVEGRRKGLLTIGYHYVIFENGELIACRPVNLIGCHCKGFNRTSIGVCLIGGRTEEPNLETGELLKMPADTFTPEQKDKLVGLFGHLLATYPELRLKGHSELGHHRKHHDQHPCPALNMETIREQCSNLYGS